MAEDYGEPIEDADLVNNIIPDDRFTITVKQIYEREIGENNATPVGAAKEAGISTQLHNKWYDQYESFRLFIYELQQHYFTKIRSRVANAFDDLVTEGDPKLIMDMGMKFLKGSEDEFGKAKSEISVTKKEEKLPDIATDDDIQSVIKAAEEAANTDPKDKT
jgi:hypothetical protein